MRVSGNNSSSHLVVTNPLPGVGAMTGLTHLVARSNYGINRCERQMAIVRIRVMLV